MTHDDPTDLALLAPMDEIPQALAPDSPYEALAPVHRADPTDMPGAVALGEVPEDIIAAGPVIPLPLRTVSGRYRGSSAGFQVELRVDVDGRHPLAKLSGDFFSVSGATVTYFGSFIVDTPAVSTTPTTITARGSGRFTFAAGAPVVQVTIPRRQILQPAAPATLRFFTAGGAPGATYICAFESAYFRTVQLETDRVSDVVTPVFAGYNTGSLPSGGAGRALSVVSASG